MRRGKLRRTLPALLLALLSIFLFAACGDDEEEPAGGQDGGGEQAAEQPGEGKPPVTLGTKDFTEEFVLGELYKQALEAKGYTVNLKKNIGATEIIDKALTSGQIDGYPEYTGTALLSFFEVPTKDLPKDPRAAYDEVKSRFAEDAITAFPPTPFTSSNEVAVTQETAEELGLQTISDLEGKAQDLTLFGSPECRQRTDCLLGLENVYDFTPEFIATEGQFEPLDQGQSDLAFVFSTDGALSLDKYYTYEDDKGLFPPYNIVLSMRDQAAEAIGPEGIDVIERVQEPLTDEVMRELNARVDLDRQEPADVAADYLREAGFVQ